MYSKFFKTVKNVGVASNDVENETLMVLRAGECSGVFTCPGVMTFPAVFTCPADYSISGASLAKNRFDSSSGSSVA